MRLETYVWSADLGEVKDYTAIAALKVERVRRPGDSRSFDAAHPFYTLGVLKRFNAADRGELQAHAIPGLDFYETLGRFLLATFRNPDKPYHENSCLIVDGTGSGRDATVRFLRGELSRTVPIFPLQIRSGETTSAQRRSGFIQVGRREVLTALHSVMDSRRLAAVAGLDLWPLLQKELLAVRYKEPRKDGVKPDDNPRVSAHDDLALSIAQAIWVTEKRATAGVGGGVFPVKWGPS